MDVLALIIAVVLIFYLMQVGFPHSARQLSAPRTYVRFYVRRIISSWVLLSIAVVILLHDGTPPSRIGLLLPNPWWSTLLAFLGVGLLFAVVLIIHLYAMNDEQMATRLARDKRRLALPRTLSERLAWVGVSVNAGIWEEIVFRGFLPWYLVHHLTLFGFAIPFVWAAVFSLILFSLGHLYQGWGGVLGVSLVGISLALLYALTGNLWASMLWHTLFDVRFSFGPQLLEGTAQHPAHAAEVSPHLVDEERPRPVPRKWHSRQQRRWRLRKDWREQSHGQEGEEFTRLYASNMVAEGEESLLSDRLEEELERAAFAQSDMRKVASESNEAAPPDASPGVPERPARGRSAREQLLHDMEGEI